VKVALVHDWLTGMRGGEYVLERLCRMFPDAPIHTLLWNRGSVSPRIESHPIHTTFLQRLPGVARHYRWYLPLFPRAIAGVRLEGFDAVISSSHCVAKGVSVAEGTFHLSYVHTPMRYVWELESQYFPPGRFPWPLSWYVRRTCARLRRWDVATSGGPHALVANSENVRGRIARHYRRDSAVVHAPVDLSRFTLARENGDYDLVVGAFAPNKRVDLAIEACRRLGRRLLVVGSGQQEDQLRRGAGRGVEFLGRVSNDQVARLYAGARALLFPGEEDFGLVPIEAMASGCPVAAYGRGGALETVGRDAGPAALERVAAGGTAAAPGGALFGTQTVEGLIEALTLLDHSPPEPALLRARAEPFAAETFDRRFRETFERAHRAWQARGRVRPARPDALTPPEAADLAAGPR
jgi:glycosyltransferase involved in cell wall biosynthesis